MGKPLRIVTQDRSMTSSGILLQPGMNICQTDLPLDWYQEEFKPYAEEYMALPSRKPEIVLPWMDRYILPAVQHFGSDLMLLAHFYMGGEIVKLVERYGGSIADSYELALKATRHPETTLFVESAVHFMAETIALLAGDHQSVYITNPKSGCTMETMAKEDMVEPLFEELLDRYGDDLLVICYMNTSGRLKALSGRTGGAVCTSSNAPFIMDWAYKAGKKIFFLPDLHLAANTAAQLGIPTSEHYLFPAGYEAAGLRLDSLSSAELKRLDDSRLLIWGGFCGVHTVFKPNHVSYWQDRGYKVLVHPECPHDVVKVADGSGSTNYLWAEITEAKPGARFAIGTEGHFVKNAQNVAKPRGVEVVNLADIPTQKGQMGCGCATMSRNDPPHLVALLDLLMQGKAPSLNHVMPGDIVDEKTGWRDRLDARSQKEIVTYARKSLEKMIELTEAAKRKK